MSMVLLPQKTPITPFDRFVWDLRPYTQAGVHTLLVEATDHLGLVGKTSAASVRIIVPSTAQGMFIAVSQKKPLLVGAAVVVSASLLVLVLILSGHIRPKLHPGQVTNGVNGTEKTRPAGSRTSSGQKQNQINNPNKTAVTESVKVSPRLKGWFERLPWFRHEELPVPAMAYLIPLVGFDEPTIPAPLQITTEAISIGSDPHLASHVIVDPSIEGLHARILRSEDVVPDHRCRNRRRYLGEL